MSDEIDLGVGQWLILRLPGGLLQVVYRNAAMTRTTLAEGIKDALAYLKGWGVEV